MRIIDFWASGAPCNDSGCRWPQQGPGLFGTAISAPICKISCQERKKDYALTWAWVVDCHKKDCIPLTLLLPCPKCSKTSDLFQDQPASPRLFEYIHQPCLSWCGARQSAVFVMALASGLQNCLKAPHLNVVTRMFLQHWSVHDLSYTEALAAWHQAARL